MFINLTISIPNESVSQLNSDCPHDSTTPYEGIRDCVKVLEALELGTKDGVVTLSITNVDPAVPAAGGGNHAVYDLS